MMLGPAIFFLLRVGALDEKIAGFELRIERLEAGRTATEAEISDLHSSGERQAAAVQELRLSLCASDTLRNQMHADELRDRAVLWKKVFGDTLPTDNAYYPTTCPQGRGDPTK